MAAPAKNEFWKLRESHGRPPMYTDPVVLLDDFVAYCKYLEENPYTQEDYVRSGNNAGKTVEVKRRRPPTVIGFCIFIGASFSWWREHKRNTTKDLLSVIHVIEDVIKNDQLSGAMAGLYKENIVSRLLGLMEHTKIHDRGRDGPVREIFRINGKDITFGE